MIAQIPQIDDFVILIEILYSFREAPIFAKQK